MSRPTPDGDPSALNGKRAWDELCALLVDLGSPIGVPQLSIYDASELREYLELMSRYADQSTASVEKFFVETPANDRVGRHSLTPSFILGTDDGPGHDYFCSAAI